MDDDRTNPSLLNIDAGLSKIIDKDPRDLGALLNRGVVRAQQNRYFDAAADLSRILKDTDTLGPLVPGNYAEYVARGEACYQFGMLLAEKLNSPHQALEQFDEALQIVEQLGCHRPHAQRQVEILYAKAKVHEYLGDVTEAILDLTQGIELCEDMMQRVPSDFYWNAARFGYLHRGRIEYIFGNRDMANGDFQTAMGFASSRWEGHFDVSSMLYLCAPKEALQHLRSALKHTTTDEQKQKVRGAMLAIQTMQIHGTTVH